MTEKIVFILFNFVLWVCGESRPQLSVSAQKLLAAYSQSAECDNCGTDGAQAEATGTHGHEIILPIGERAYLPADWYWVDEDYGPSVRRRDNARTGPMDWGDGNSLYSVLSYSRPPLASVFIFAGKDYQVVGRITGMFANIQPGLVRGSVELTVEQDRRPMPAEYQAIELVLQVHDGQTWVDIASRIMRTGHMFQVGELESTAQPSTPVRFEVRAWRDPSSALYVYVTKLRLFGAECYVDQSDPTRCL